MNNACVAWYDNGAYVYGWSGNDLNYSGESFSNGAPVNNDVGQGRDRNSYYVTVCYYQGLNWTGGLTGIATWATSWVPIGQQTSSHWMKIQSTC